VPLPVAVLDTVSVPEIAPATVGANLTVSVAVCLGLSVSGSAGPETVNPVPLVPNELIVSGCVPPAVNVTVCVAEALTSTLLKLRLDTLAVSDELDAPSDSTKAFDTPPAVAVSVAVCAVETAETVAEKPMLVVPDPTVTPEGTVTAALLLTSVTAAPPLAAAAFSVTVQASLPAPVIDPSVQLIALGIG
jgi:hypothetical protein